MNKRLEKDVLTETYKDMEKLVCKIAWRFAKTYNADFEEVQAETNLIFINAMKTYDKEKGALSTHLTHQITRRLQTYFKQQWKQQNQIPTINVDLVCIETPSSDFTLIDIIDEVGEDARTLIDLVLETPVDFMNAIRPNRRNLRASMKRHSTKILGWTKRHYKETFEEVTNAL